MVHRQTLAAIPSLADAPGEVLEALARCAYPLSFESGQRVVKIYDPPKRFFFLRDGLAGLTGVSIHGKERIAFLYRAGDVIGSRFLIETPEVSYEVVALTSVRGVGISVTDLERIGQDHPEILLSLTRAFVDRVDRLSERLLRATTLEVPVRLAGVLVDLADGDHGDGDGWCSTVAGLPHRVLAEIVGASRPHISAVLADLEAAGGVRRNGRKSLEVHPERLERIVAEGTLAKAG